MRVQFLAWALSVSLTSCAGPGVEHLVVQMDWTHEAEYTGFYAAEAQGYFRQAGVAVTLVEGPPGTDVPAALGTGRADAAQMGLVMYQSAAQTDPDLVAVFATLQTSPRVILTLANRGVKSPRDLEGLTVGVKSPSWGALVRKVMANAGADPSRIREVPVKTSDIARFYTGEISVWTGFATGEPVEAALAGHPVNQLFADDYGAGGYDELIVVRRSALEKAPDAYYRLIAALVKGWTWAADHGDDVPALLDRWQPAAGHLSHELAWKALRPLVITGKDPVGWIRNDRWPGIGTFSMKLLDQP